MTLELPHVSVSELNNKPGEILDRVLRGERFIVCRHRRPVATLQPLNGAVLQPLGGWDHDVGGSQLGDVADELEKLSDHQRMLLRDGVRLGRVTGLPLGHPFKGTGIGQALDDLELRGYLARGGKRGGWVLTARGLLLREELLAQAGADFRDCWLDGRAWPSPSP